MYSLQRCFMVQAVKNIDELRTIGLRKKIEILHVSNNGTFEIGFIGRKINSELRDEILKFYSNRNLYVFRIQYERLNMPIFVQDILRLGFQIPIFQ